MTIKRTVAALLALCLLCTGCIGSKPGEGESTPGSPDSSSEQSDVPDSPPKPLTEIATGLTLDSELISCAVHTQRGLLRIEEIAPGLDTYDLTVTLYDLHKNTVLGKVELGEGAWETGWTAEGFYAISLLSKTAFLYDLNGKMMRQIPLPTSVQSLSMAMLNMQADTFLLGDGTTAKLLLYEVSSGKTTAVAPMNGSISPLTYKNGRFYTANNTTGEVLCVEDQADIATSPLVGQDATLLTEDLAVSRTDTNFKITLPDNDTTYYVPFDAVDEIPMATADKAFVTAVCRTEKDVLALYDVSAETVRRMDVPHAVEQVHFLNGYELLVVTRDTDRHRLYVRHFTEQKPEKITVSKTDREAPVVVPDISEPEAPIPSGTHILDVPLLSQWPEFPTGCESVSAIMALRYLGESLTVTRFIREFLPQSAHFYYEDGVRYGPSPYEYFLGTPTTDAAYGCMEPVIRKALTAYFGSDDRLEETTGTSLDELCRTYIDHDLPVLVWVTIAMIDTYPSSSWHLEDGTLFQWPANEHCMVLVGYDEYKYYFNDPYTGQVMSYARTLCETRYEQMGKQSLVITRGN